MKMSFYHPKARAQLLEHNVCYTLRQSKAFYYDQTMKVTITDTGYTGIRYYAGKSKLPDDGWERLHECVGQSGFASVEEWQEAALRFSGPGTYILYRVELDPPKDRT